MGRRQQELPGAGTPEEALAAFLRSLRAATGLTYRQMATLTGDVSAATLSRADGGRVTPKWAVVHSYVLACGAPAEQLERARELWARADRASAPAARGAEAARGRWLPGALRVPGDLAQAMAEVRQLCGGPTLRQLSQRAAASGMRLSRSTLSEALNGTRVPSCEVFVGYMTLMTGFPQSPWREVEPDEWRQAWQRVTATGLSREPAGPRSGGLRSPVGPPADEGHLPVRRPRRVRRPPLTPGPLGELKDLLYSLYLQAGTPSLDAVARLIRADQSLPGAPERDSISRALASGTLPPQQGDAVSIAIALARLAGVDRAEAAARTRELWVAAARVAPPGIPMDRVSPVQAGVRPAVTWPHTGSGPSVPHLPVYVERTHDHALRAVVQRAAQGLSEMVLVVGEQHSGRTRACWEALQGLPAGWVLWQPDCSEGAGAVAAAVAAVGPRTVLWLGDLLGQWLTGPDSAAWMQVVTELADAVHTTGRGPLLVLACLGSDTWSDLRRYPKVAAGAWEYLLATQTVMVPAAFQDTEVAVAARRDPRVELALHHSQQGRIAAFLSDHQQVASARRLEEILAQSQEEALAGDTYALHTVAALLDQTNRTTQVADWYRRAAESGCPEAVRPAADHLIEAEGHTVAVTWLQRRAESGDSRAALVLAQYLDADGKPGSALPWYRRAAEGGQRAALHPAAAKLRRAGRSTEALRWLRARARQGLGEALLEGAFLLQRLERRERALAWFERAADAGAVEAFRGAGDMLREAGLDEPAVDWYWRAAQGGDLAAARIAARLLHEGGRTAESLDLYEWAAELGDVVAMRQAAVILHRQGRRDQALGWYERAADSGDSGSAQIAAALLRQSGRIQEAFTRYREVADAGNIAGLREAAWMLWEDDRFEEAVNWLKVRAVTGNGAAVAEVAELLREGGRTEEAIAWYGHAADRGSAQACLRAAVLVEQHTGNIDKALPWYRRAALTENSGVVDVVSWASHGPGPAPGVMAFPDAPLWPGFPASRAAQPAQAPVVAPRPAHSPSVHSHRGSAPSGAPAAGEGHLRLAAGH
ncbi:helix-turn-helix domain-containing protein [Kitasatospora indigofera]|uniref:helix-turn-helix domain-containing protein n=1 Tax=Kitasatospora indigofera TaxID=67307 RepID=UPI0036814EEF